MFSKAALSLVVLAVARIAAANPYCLLKAVNTFDHPADQKTLCCKLADTFKEQLESECESSDLKAATQAYEDACEEAGYKDCEDDTSSSSSSASHSKTSSKTSSSTSAPYPIVSTTTYYDTECSCTKTSTHVSSGVASTGFVTASNPIATGTSVPVPSGGSGSGSGSGSGAIGSPISPAGPGATGSGSGSSPSGESFTGAATKNVGSVAAGLLAVAGIALAL